MRVIIGLIALVWLMSGCATPDRSGAVVVIDAGHGGQDPGAMSGGKREKDVVLKIAKKVRKALEENGHPVYMTRDSDRFLNLWDRTRIADHKNAMVFISVHANAAPSQIYNERMQGIETYFLQESRDERSQRIAARENASVLIGMDSLSQDVVIDSVLNGPKIIESHKLAIDVQRQMLKSVHGEHRDVKDGGVRPAPFYVLVGASRPSVLIEVGYITNDKERARLLDEDYQEAIAKGVAKGVSKYLDNRKKEIDI